MNRPVTSRSVPVAMVATKKNMPKQRPRCTAASMDLCTYQRNSQPSSPQYSASTTAIVGGTNGTGDPSGSTSLDVPTLAQMYNFPNTGAANQTIALLALLSELTRLASSQRGRLHPGFRRLGHPPRRRICLQCQLGNLHWRDLHPLDHQFSFTALSRCNAKHLGERNQQ